MLTTFFARQLMPKAVKKAVSGICLSFDCMGLARMYIRFLASSDTEVSKLRNRV
jgi:hypothetical protein